MGPTARERWYLQQHIQRLSKYLQRTEGIPAYAAVYFRLRDLDYSVEAGLFTAAECGAPHRRQRLFILAHSDGVGYRRGGKDLCERNGKIQITAREWAGVRSEILRCREGLADTSSTELSGRQSQQGNDAENCQAVAGSGGLWPSRPGQPQYEWEEPRVVSHSKKHRYKGFLNKGKGGENLMSQVGKLNPAWVEQLMGLPTGWTALGSWATGLSRSRLKGRLDTSTKDSNGPE